MVLPTLWNSSTHLVEGFHSPCGTISLILWNGSTHFVERFYSPCGTVLLTLWNGSTHHVERFYSFCGTVLLILLNGSTHLWSGSTHLVERFYLPSCGMVLLTLWNGSTHPVERFYSPSWRVLLVEGRVVWTLLQVDSEETLPTLLLYLNKQTNKRKTTQIRKNIIQGFSNHSSQPTGGLQRGPRWSRKCHVKKFKTYFFLGSCLTA